MRQTNLGRHQGIAVLTALSMLLVLGGAAQAAPEEDAPNPTAQPETQLPPKAEPQPGPPVTASAAPATQTLNIESMGPETFPGRMRGLSGGSLWLEPSFHGLQWPQNARTGLGLSGTFWVDGGYETIKRSSDTMPNSSLFVGQGRGLLRVTPAYVRDGFFIQGQAELVGNLCQTANMFNTVCGADALTTDDLWIRFGQWNLWDVKVGRFEGWEVYHLGMGLDPNTLERMGARMFGVDSTTGLEAPSFYGVNYLHDRPTDGLGVGYAALHAYATQWLRFEGLLKLGTDNYRNDVTSTGITATGNPASTYFGERLTAILDVGSSEFKFKLKIGGERQTRTPITQDIATTPGSAPTTKDPVEQTVQEGLGASAQFVIYPFIEFGLNGAIGRQVYTNSSGNSPSGPGYEAALPLNYTTKSVGGFANLRLADLWLAGLGLNFTEQTDMYYAPLSSGGNTSTPDYTSHLQAFAAVQYLLGGQLFIKAVLGYAKAYFQASDPDALMWNNYMYSGRIRLMYLY